MEKPEVAEAVSLRKLSWSFKPWKSCVLSIGPATERSLTHLLSTLLPCNKYSSRSFSYCLISRRAQVVEPMVNKPMQGATPANIDHLSTRSSDQAGRPRSPYPSWPDHGRGNAQVREGKSLCILVFLHLKPPYPFKVAVKPYSARYAIRQFR